MQRVQLNGYWTRFHIPRILHRLQAAEPAPEELVLDWADQKFIDPVGLTLVAAHAVTMARDGARIDFENFDEASYPARVRIQDICGLEDEYPFRRHDPDERFTNVERIRDRPAANEYSERASRVLHVDERLRQLADTCLSEMLTNVYDHAWSPCHAIAQCQFYPDRDEVVYAVADRGVGIFRKVYQARAITDPFEAIETAVSPGFTTTSGEKNAGLGLTIAKHIAVSSGGSFTVLCDEAMVRYEGKRVRKIRISAWPGTAVVGTIPARSDVTLQTVLGDVQGS